MGWSEKLIEPGNSWFSLKQLLGWRRIDWQTGVEHWKKRRPYPGAIFYQTPNTVPFALGVSPRGLTFVVKRERTQIAG